MSGRGHQRERAVRAWYADRDWLAFRAPASLGVADVIAIKTLYPTILYPPPGLGSIVHLVEVKSTAGGPYERFQPADREKLRLAAEMAGATPLLAWWPPRGQLRFIPESEWPRGREASAPRGAPKASNTGHESAGKSPGAPDGEENS